MRIPSTNLVDFVAEIANSCMSSRDNRKQRGDFFQRIYDIGSVDGNSPAIFNKTASAIDLLNSLLYSPISMRFHISDPDIPNIVNEAKGRAASTAIRNLCRRSDSDTLISRAVKSSLISGLGITKQSMKQGKLSAELVKPEDFGVLYEAHTALDVNMEAFCHCMMITWWQFERLIRDLPDSALLRAMGEALLTPSNGTNDDGRNAVMDVIVGGQQPYQPSGGSSSIGGVVEWMGQPKPALVSETQSFMLEMREVWVWNDAKDDWATFQLIGDKILLLGRYNIVNALAYDPEARTTARDLQQSHPFNTFCVNPVDDYFFGRSELTRVFMLQEAINARIVGTNKLLRKQEDPPTKFTGSTGVNQVTFSKFNKPGGYWTDTNPNAKIEKETIQVPPDLWGSLQQYERMFDAMMGMPPTVQGQGGGAGMRSGVQAEVAVSMASAFFKERALGIERDVESFGALTLDLARAGIARKLLAWVPEAAAGVENVSSKDELEILRPPAPGLVPVYFSFSDLPEDVSLTVDSHSSSPLFAMEAKALVFDLVKIGAMSPLDVVEHVDAPNPDELAAGIVRREIAKAEQMKVDQQIKMAAHAGHK